MKNELLLPILVFFSNSIIRIGDSSWWCLIWVHPIESAETPLHVLSTQTVLDNAFSKNHEPIIQ